MVQKIDLARRQQHLRARINSFTHAGNEHIDEEAMDIAKESMLEVLEDDLSDEEEVLAAEAAMPTTAQEDPENQKLLFLSAIPLDQRHYFPKLQGLLSKELEMRKGQANDALQRIREALSQLAWQFKSNVQTASSTKQSTHAWGGVAALSRELCLQRRIYNHSRQTMIKLSCFETVNAKFPFLEERDCKPSTVVADPNARGISNQGLPWFWSQVEEAGGKDIYMSECVYFFKEHNLLLICFSSTLALVEGPCSF